MPERRPPADARPAMPPPRRARLRTLAALLTLPAAMPGRAAAQARAGECVAIPSEIAGPFPADGTRASRQRLNVLAEPGVVRPDLRTSIGTGRGVARGIPLTMRLRLVDAAGGCAPLAGRALYLWHCTQDGEYSMYAPAYSEENFLRGVQVTDAAGEVAFTTIFPGCYRGRWPHLHLAVYESLAAATDAGSVGDHLKMTQIALPEDACRAVYQSTPGYETSLGHFGRLSLARDGLFRDDGAVHQLATATRDAKDGWVASLTVGLG